MSYDVRTDDGRAAGVLNVSRSGLKTVFDYSSDLDPGPSRLVLTGEAGLLSVGVPIPAGGGLRLTRGFTRLALGGFDPELPFRAVLIPADADPSALRDPELPPESPSGPAPEPELRPAPPSPPESEPPLESAPPSEPAPPDMTEPECAQPEPSDGDICPEPPSWRAEPDPARHFTDPILRASASQTAGVLSKIDGDDILLAFPWAPSMPFPMLPVFRLGTAQEINGGQYMVFRLKNGQPL